MSDSTPTPDIPKPNIPQPSIPKPNIPAPNLDRASSGPPISAVETGAMETAVTKPAPAEEEKISSIEYSETLLPQRILAGLIDGIVAAVLIWAAGLVLPDFLGIMPNAFGIVYLLFKDSLPFLGGQSVGKKAMKIQAVTEDGVPLTKDFTKGIVRNVFTAIPPLALVELFILHTREKAPNAGLRLGDDFAKTKVITVKSEATESIESSEE
ncbi:MAG: RDD family protein [Roseibacillus sp.]